ncbi:MAG: N-acetyltransferase [Nitrospirae bacterium]|nr:N-acetyltransferase [Nitrospirota bacterium]
MLLIKEAKSRGEILQFIRFPLRLYKDDPYYAPQLTRDMLSDFSPKKNPFFQSSKVRFFLLYSGKEIVGRIVSIINGRHLEIHNDGVGFFGFYESVDDTAVASRLLEVVQEELRGGGLKIMRGPMNFSTNEECGFLIDGFDTPPMIMTTHNPPYYKTLMESCGMLKAKDLYAYAKEVPADGPPDKVNRVADIAQRRGITVRPLSMKNFRNELALFKDIYNSSWKDNWGFIPISDAELEYMGTKLKTVIVPELMLIAQAGEEVIGFLGLLPDFNFVLRKMHGKLNPITLIKALYYSRKITGARLLLFGVKPQYRFKGVDALLTKDIFRRAWEGGYKLSEFSWILEDNEAIKKIIELVEGRLYKTYRIYEKPI